MIWVLNITNTFIPKVIAEARNYELTEDENSRKLSDFFWHTMIDHHTFAPGCSSDKEHYFDPARFSKHVSGYTGETCCTYNMLKLSRHLFCWTADAAIADYYERALYNPYFGTARSSNRYGDIFPALAFGFA